MNAPDLDALEALLAGDVTALPWAVDPKPVKNGSHEGREVRRLEHTYNDDDAEVPVLTSHVATFDGWPKGDAALAVGAVNALPALVAQAREARRLRDLLGRFVASADEVAASAEESDDGCHPEGPYLDGLAECAKAAKAALKGGAT